jgi:hypothetical protein
VCAFDEESLLCDEEQRRTTLRQFSIFNATAANAFLEPHVIAKTHPMLTREVDRRAPQGTRVLLFPNPDLVAKAHFINL